MRSKELVICGMKAVRSRFEVNSHSVKRLFFNKATAPAVGDLCQWMARERLVYRCVENEELESISGSVHHGGVVVVVEPSALVAPLRDEVRRWAHLGQTLLILDRIGNVHNLGAIIRSAAYFGVTNVILPNHPQAAIPTEATYRVAEGALDHVNVYSVNHLPSFVDDIRDVYFVVGAASRGGDPRIEPAHRLPISLVLGNEEQGLSPEIADLCNLLVTIPGSNLVESLNVSAAAAVLLWQITRGRSQPGPVVDDTRNTDPTTRNRARGYQS